MHNLLPRLFNLLVSDCRAVGITWRGAEACGTPDMLSQGNRAGDVFDKISFQSGGSAFLKREGKGTKEEERKGQTFLRTPEMTTIEQLNHQ